MREKFESGGARWALLAGALAALVGGVVLTWRLASAPPLSESVAAEAARARGPAAAAAVPAAGGAPRITMLTVYVSGEVTSPGVFQLPRGARVSDAIDAAGGLLADADTARLPNLAARLTDGKQVKVPRRGLTTAAASRVDINSASVEELMVVPGMDVATAQAIVEERDAYGPYLSLTDLHTLLGLDTQVVASLRPFLRVAAP